METTNDVKYSKFKKVILDAIHEMEQDDATTASHHRDVAVRDKKYIEKNILNARKCKMQCVYTYEQYTKNARLSDSRLGE